MLHSLYGACLEARVDSHMRSCEQSQATPWLIRSMHQISPEGANYVVFPEGTYVSGTVTIAPLHRKLKEVIKK